MARILPSTTKKIDEIFSNGYDSGLWHLAVVAVGVIGVFSTIYILIHATQYLRKVLTDPVDSENYEIMMAIRIFIAVACSVGFILMCKRIRDAHYRSKYQNKGFFGRPVNTQSNGLQKLTVQEFED